MEGQKIIEAITIFFKGADDRDWEAMHGLMAEKVLLDYTSMVGGDPNLLTPVEITNGWATFLPGFDKTHHQVSAFRVKLHGHDADVDYAGKADHFMDDEVWTVEGTYHTKLKKGDNGWLITHHKFNCDRQSGNTYLPKRAKEKLGTL
jgi:hypothetical protein